jgi:methyl coenzyme M reductase subunit D
MSGISIPSEKPIVIYEDNSGCMALTKNPANHSRTKHIHVKYHYLRQQVEIGEIQLVQCKTNDMTADILTKALPRDKHEIFSTAMGLDV